MRLSMLIMTGLMLASAGCQSNQSHYDPFLGRTTVPPPGTIQTGPPGTAPPLYQGMPPTGTAPAGVPAPVGAPVTAPATPPLGTPPPPGAYGMPQSSLQPSKAMQAGPGEYVAGTSAIARRSPVVTAPPAQAPVALTSGQTAPGPTASQAWQPAAAPTAATGTAEPGRLAAPEPAVTIPSQ